MSVLFTALLVFLTRCRVLQRQLDLAQRRSHQLNDVIDANRVAGSPASNSSR